MRIKICGFTRAQDVHDAIAAGVDAIGLNLARGPRRIELAHAASLAALIPPLVHTVALFVDADEATILSAASALRCSAVQLHGDEPPELAASLRRRLPLIKAFRIASAADLARVRGYPADAFLLDAAVPGAHGGTGVVWDHQLLAGCDLGAPVILAGGLTPDNVAAAISAAQPWAVDTASGVECAPGVKDAGRMRAFVTAARSTV
jgi:phosphoribosylanthranilate isomerase